MLHQFMKFASQEKDWLPFQAALPGLIGLENRDRASAKGAVVEKMDVWIEEKVFF